MTITISLSWIPIVLTFVLLLFGIHNLKDSASGYFGDIGALFLAVLCFGGILIVWTSFYAVLYFLK